MPTTLKIFVSTNEKHSLLDSNIDFCSLLKYILFFSESQPTNSSLANATNANKSSTNTSSFAVNLVDALPPSTHTEVGPQQAEDAPLQKKTNKKDAGERFELFPLIIFCLKSRKRCNYQELLSS